MGSFEFPGLRAVAPSVTAASPPVLSSDAAQQSGNVLRGRRPPGTSESLENRNPLPSPTEQFVAKQIASSIPAPTEQRKIKEQGLDAATGHLRRRDSQLETLSSKLPAVDFEEINRQRLQRALEERAKAEAEGASEEEKSADAPTANKSKNASATRAYQAQNERARSLPPPPADPQPKERGRKDVAAGGAGDEEKGDPGVNLVA